MYFTFNLVISPIKEVCNLLVLIRNWYVDTFTFSYLYKELCVCKVRLLYEGVSKSFRTDRLEGELQMVQLSATRCSYIAILWVSLVSFVAITVFVASQRVFIISLYFVVDSVRKHLRILTDQCIECRGPEHGKCNLWCVPQPFDHIITMAMFPSPVMWNEYDKAYHLAVMEFSFP
jgi:hypothetical protein